MAIEHISEFDTLNAGREKINNHAIDPANRAEINSIDAKSVANQANQTSQNAEAIAVNTDDRLDNIIASEMQDAEVIDARKPFGEEAFPNLGKRLDEQLGKLYTFRPSEASLILKITQEALERGVLATSVGVVGDGIVDDYDAIVAALDTYQYVLLPTLNYRTTKQIRLKQGQSLVGITTTVRDYGKTAKITYDGEVALDQAVVLVGRNLVGAEPTLDGTNIALINVNIDCNNKAGFGVYGTYLTNETLIDNIVVKNSLEYNFYFARCWYATFVNLTSMDCRNIGMSFGMKIYYLDGRVIEWTTANPLEMNQCKIDNVRAIRSGKYFSIDNPGMYKVALHKYLGFGIGAGLGHSFVITNWLSEQTGGVALYNWNGAQKVKVIEKGYIEKSCLNSGLVPDLDLPVVIIESTTASGGKSIIRDLHVNYQSGGIFHTGPIETKHHLENVHEPRFLRSLDGLSLYDLYSVVLKKNVHYDCGSYNTDPSSQTIDSVTKVNTRYSFTIEMNVEKRNRALWVKAVEGGFYGGIDANNSSGGKTNFAIPQDLSKTEWTRLGVLNRNVISLTKSGTTGPEERNIMIKVVNLESTEY